MDNLSRHVVDKHLFGVGDMVRFDPRNGSVRTPGGVFCVQAQLPKVGNELQYRIKNANESHQRVAAEYQLLRSLPAAN